MAATKATNPFDFEDEYSDSELPQATDDNDDDGRYDDAEEEDDDFDAWVRKPEQIAQVSTAYSWMHPAGSAAQHSHISTLLSLS